MSAAVAEQFQQEQQYQPEQPVNQQYGQDAAYAASNEASTEYVDPYMNPADLSEVADYSSSQPQNEPEQQYAEQQYAAAQESPADAGFTAELAMNHHRSDADGPYRQRSGRSFVRVLRAIRTSIRNCLPGLAS